MTNSKKTNISKSIIAGLSVASAALLVYLYGTKKGAKKIKELKGWMLMMKGEVIHKLEKLKEINKETYDKVVDEVSGKFEKMKEINSGEVSKLNGILKKGWADIKKEVGVDSKTTKTNKKSR